ncbi:autotransporter outer membrane beta-barrel domain-containing protein [Pseudomonas sp.]|uniref:autotransporter outer membrane beta-barrel domain-containing protein n=1 Tax=Pseudomonas sp. TaxID=306 RepID=UPI003D6E54EF
MRASNLEGNILVAETASATLNVDNASLVGDINSNGNTTANFTQSTFTGAVNVGSNATVNLALDQARMVGDVIVQQGGNASLGLNNGAQLTGTVNAATGSTVNLALDQARMAGDVIVQQDGNASLRLNNGAQLTGTVNAATGSTVNLALNQASMVGDVLAEQGSITTVVLNNNAQLTGKLANVQQLEINSGSAWTMTGDSTLGNLAMSNGRVTMGDNATFQRLNVTNLSGNGDFHMASDFATGASDFINVTGTSSGNHGLLVASSGSEAGVESVQLVQTADGGAQFHLLNDRGQVDVGAYSYQLAAKDNGWYLDQETRTISPGTRAVMALFNSPITVAYGEQASLRSRMGELRYSQGRSAGVWARAYGNQYNIADASSGVGYQQNQRGLSLGADMRVGESDWLVGVLAGSSRSDLNLSYGTSGSIDSYYLGGYATWLDSETGYYVDTVLKYNRYQNNAKVGLSDGTRAKGDYDTHGMSASVEAGKHIKLNDGVFIEPFAKVDVATVAGKDFSLDNSMRAEGDSSQSLLGKAGVTLGKTIELGADSMVQPYVKAAFAHEFAQRNEVQVNNNVFNNDLSGSRAELGAGVVLSLSKQFQVHVDVDYMNGKNIEQPYGVNVGLRYAF